jgi:ABC-2 type transport system ATP-binding protein
MPDNAPTAAGTIIHAAGLTKQFGNEIAVEDVSFEVPNGAIFGYVGPSGSGKTTTLRLLTGIYTPSAGKATVLGHEPRRFNRRTRQQIGYMPQLFVLYPDLTVWENLNFAASIYGMGLRRRHRLNEVLDFVELMEHRDKPARQISGGMQRRLSLAATLVHDPKLIFLDEPTAGIDPVLRRKFWDHFKHLQQAGRTLFITTQYVSETAYCDLVGVMADRHLLMVDTPTGLRHRAYGGDMVDLRTVDRADFSAVSSLRQLPFVRHVQRGDADNGVRLVVDEAGTAIPSLIEWCRTHGVAVEAIEEYVPPFDDVFVELVRQGNGS